MDKTSTEDLEKTDNPKLTFKKNKSKDGRVRPKSASKYICTGFEYNSTTKPYKRHSNPSVIEKILKKSLQKAKNEKLCLKKESKLKILKSEIRKNEIEYQNKKIRLNNSLSMRNKRAKSKEKTLKTKENPIYFTLKTDNSPQTRNIDHVLMTSCKKAKKKPVSDRKHKNSNILDYIKRKKTQRQRQEFEEKVTKKAQKLVKERNIAKLEEFITKSFRKSPEASFDSYENSFDPYKSGNFHDINQNISFIYEDGSERSIEKDDEMCAVKALTGKTFETDAKFTETLDDERKSTDLIFKTKDFSNTVKSPEFKSMKFQFPATLEVQTQENFNIEARSNKKSTLGIEKFPIILTIPSKPCLSIIHCSNLSIPKTITKNSDFSTQTTRSLQISKPISTYLKSSVPAKATLKTIKTETISLKSSSRLANSVDLDHYSWNLALTFLIDQLHLYEISDISENFPNASSQVLKKIGKKYSGIKSYLQNCFEKYSNDLLENLNFEQHTSFIQKTHSKKIEIQKVLTELFEDSFENSEGEDSKSGITHSQSLQHLHVSPEKKEKSKDLVVSFGFEDQEGKEAMVISISDGESSGNIMEGSDLKSFIEDVFKVINWKQVFQDLAKPLIKNPLTELDKLQETQIGSFTETQIFNFPELFNCESLLKLVDETEKLQDFEKVYRKMILHVLNGLLQQFRPFGYHAMPLPWVTTSRIGRKAPQLEDVQDKVLSDLLLLNSFEIGSIVEIDPWIKKPSEAQLIKFKENQLDKILFFEAILEEERWVDYEFEESQVKIDLADMILQDLALELIKIVE